MASAWLLMIMKFFMTIYKDFNKMPTYFDLAKLVIKWLRSA